MRRSFVILSALILSGYLEARGPDSVLPPDSAELLGKLNDFAEAQQFQAEVEIAESAKAARQLLAQHQSRETKAGHLEAALAIKAVIQKLGKTGEAAETVDATGTGTAKESKLPRDSAQVLEKLDTFAQKRHDQAESEIGEKAKAVTRVLEQHQLRETKAGRLEAALAIKTESAKLAESWKKQDSEKTQNSTASPSSSRKMRIARDAVNFEGHSYLVITEDSPTWEESKEACEKLGGHLAIVNSQEEHDFLSKMAPEKFLYLGAKLDADKENPSKDWTWVDGSSVDTGYGQGLKLGLERPMSSYLVFWKGGWHAHKNNSAFANGYICEWPGLRE